jgi:hypothetical protein
MLEIVSHDEFCEVDGVSFIKTRFETLALQTPEQFFNQHAVQRRPICKRSMWRHLNVTFIENIVNADYFDQTFLHVPTQYARILRWLNPPKKRVPNLLEQHEAEADRLAFSTELSLTEQLSVINHSMTQQRLLIV